MFAALEGFKGQYQLPLYQFPQIVWLPNRDDRLSAQIVCLENIRTEIAATVRLKGIFVEMTADRPDGVIYEKIPWLKTRVTEEKSHLVNSTIYPDHFELMSYYLLGDR